jgi:hypothetical protein
MTINMSDRTLRVTRRTAIKYGASTLALAAAVGSTVVTAAPRQGMMGGALALKLYPTKTPHCCRQSCSSRGRSRSTLATLTA